MIVKDAALTIATAWLIAGDCWGAIDDPCFVPQYGSPESVVAVCYRLGAGTRRAGGAAFMIRNMCGMIFELSMMSHDCAARHRA